MKKYIHNIRCGRCNSIYSTDELLPVSHYNGFDSYCCKNCGSTRLFVGCYEIWVSKRVWYKPWTWFKGEWRNVK